MEELWFRTLGFYNNPFSIKPAAFSDEVIGYNLDEVFDKIDSGKIVYVIGGFGTGKTTLMKHIIRRFGGRRQVVHVTRSTSEESMNTEKILRGKYGFCGKFFRGLPSQMILLVDEAQDITNEDSEQLLKHYQRGNIKSVVFFGAHIAKQSFVKDMEQLLNGNTINLNALTDDQAVSLIRRRIGSSKMISDSMIKRIVDSSSGNPRTLLENCEDACRLAAASGSREVGERQLEELFGSKLNREPEINIEELGETIEPLRPQLGDSTEIAGFEEPSISEDTSNVMFKLEEKPKIKKRVPGARPKTALKTKTKAKAKPAKAANPKKRSAKRPSRPKYKKQAVKSEIKAELADEEPEYLM